MRSSMTNEESLLRCNASECYNAQFANIMQLLQIIRKHNSLLLFD